MTLPAPADAQPKLDDAAYFRSSLQYIANTLQDLELDDKTLRDVIETIATTKVPLICSGVGKSGFIASKLVATLNSFAIPAVFLNPTDALHGDLGIVTNEAVAIVISNSGSTTELINLLPALQARSCRIVSIVSRAESPLGRAAQFCLAYGEVTEVDAYNLAPTTSTVVQMAIVDVLAASVSFRNGLNPRAFYRNHPAGKLGKRLMPVESLMRTEDRMPVVAPEDPVLAVLHVITSKFIGCACVADSTGQLLGIVTDGDLRRALEKDIDIKASLASDIMTRSPKVARIGDRIEMLLQSDDFLGRHFTLPVLDEAGILQGVLVSIDLI